MQLTEATHAIPSYKHVLCNIPTIFGLHRKNASERLAHRIEQKKKIQYEERKKTAILNHVNYMNMTF